MRLLLDNITIIPMTGQNEILDQGYLIIDNDIIAEMGAGQAPEGNYEVIIDGTNKVALPGFINTHTHAAMTLLRGYADDLPLMEWLETKIWPLEAKLNGEYVYWGTMLALTEMIKSGTTAFADMYFFMDEVALAVEKSGIRGILARGMVGVGPENESAFQDSIQMVKLWHQKAEGRINIMLGPHAPYTCPPDYLKRVAALAEELQVGIHIHLAETRGEFEDISKQYGQTPTAYLEETGLFRNRVVAAHCVWMNDEDLAILKKNGVGVAHNPESNMKLASGIARVPDMLKEGIPVALGTDGASSNNNLDMLQEMRSAAYLHKVNCMDTTVIPAYQALEMATLNGAKVLGLDNETGRLQPGKKADMILISLNRANMIPRYDIIANIVYSAQAADVDTVIVNGRIIMQNREIQTFNEQEVLTQAKRIAEKLVE